MAKSKYENMSADEIDAKIIEMNNALAEQRAEILEAQGWYAEKRRQENALARLDGLSDEERESLMHAISVGSLVTDDEGK
jgi:hypothetical protein